MTTTVKFIKMDGLGNDFVIVDEREEKVQITPEQIIALSSRSNKETKGCDQFGIIKTSKNADCLLKIYNANGKEAETCGNLIRCVAHIIMKQLKKGVVSIDTMVGIKHAALVGTNKVKVDMGEPKFDWIDIPLTNLVDTMNVPIEEGELKNPAVVNVGNPHAVFFVDNIKDIDLETLGPKLENNKIFPEKANICVANVVSDDTIKLRVFERDVGETKACGSGACATAVNASRKGLCRRLVTVQQEGGAHEIQWLDNNRVMMTGPINHQFEGTVEI